MISGTDNLDQPMGLSGLSLRQLIHRLIHYMILHMHAARIIQTDPAQLDAITKGLETSPDREYIAIITGEPGHATPHPKGMPQNQEERWNHIQAYHEFVEREPVDYLGHFWRGVYCTTATITLQDFIDEELSHLKGGRVSFNNYFNKHWAMELQKAVPDLARKVHQDLGRQHSPSAARSTCDLLDDILDSNKPPSATAITSDVGQTIIGDEQRVTSTMFRVEVAGDTIFWRVMSVKHTGRGTKFWVQFSPFADDDSTDEEMDHFLEEDDVDSQIRVSQEDLLLLLLRSTEVVATTISSVS